MAKRSSGSTRANRTAQQLGRLLGQVAARVDSWKQQRDALRSDLASIVETANGLMDDLGGAAATGRKAGRQAGKAVGKARREVSSVARARMASAARRRWQRYRAEKAKSGK